MNFSTDSTKDNNSANEQKDESEEVRQLRARVAELESAQRMSASSVASFDVLASNGDEEGTDESQNEGNNEAFADKEHQKMRRFGQKLAKMEMELKDTKQLSSIAKFELENSVLQAEFKHQKLLTEHNSLQVKMAEMEKEKQKIANQLEQQQNDQTDFFVKLENLEMKNECNSKELKNAIDGILTKTDELALQKKDSELFIDVFPSKFAAMEKFMGILKDRFSNELLNAVHPNIRPNVAEVFSNNPKNCWDANACHCNLVIFEPEYLMVYYKTEKNEYCSVFAKCSVPKNHFGIFYFEAKIVNVKRCIRIGLATKSATDGGIGQMPYSFSYSGSGTFRVEGTEYKEKTTFTRDDVVGCGVNLASGRIIFTKNGQRLDTANLFICSTDQLFPCVSLQDSGDLVEANFGPNFKFNPSDV